MGHGSLRFTQPEKRVLLYYTRLAMSLLYQHLVTFHFEEPQKPRTSFLQSLDLCVLNMFLIKNNNNNSFIFQIQSFMMSLLLISYTYFFACPPPHDSFMQFFSPGFFNLSHMTSFSIHSFSYASVFTIQFSSSIFNLFSHDFYSGSPTPHTHTSNYLFLHTSCLSPPMNF